MRENIIRLRKKGLSYKLIAKELGCAKSTVSYHCKNAKLDEKLPQPNKLSKETIVIIRNDYLTKTAIEISNNLKISTNSVYKYTNNISKNNKLSIIYLNCLNCDIEYYSRNKNSKYCSQKCKNDYNRQMKINDWLNGKHDGSRGKTGTAYWIKEYLIDKHGEKCMECGWDVKNKYTNKIPIELEHIDGDFTNNKEENLKLLCPNCHSLTSTYKGANKKKGRPRAKYYRGI